jgi:Zn-finger nucleic acid-binding protein
MPHLICPTCGLTTYSAAGHATTDRCPRCDRPLKDAGRRPGVVRRWRLADMRLLARREGVEHEAR